MVLGICIGFLLGALVVNVYLKESEQTNERLKKTINNLEDDIDLANSKIENRDRVLNDYQKESEILLDNASEYRQTINELEEFKNKVIDIVESEHFAHDKIDKIKELVDLPKSN